jgi:quinol monooxygenase YgiN
MEFVDAEAEATHRQTEHVRRYVERLYPLCLEEPSFTRYRPVDR